MVTYFCCQISCALEYHGGVGDNELTSASELVRDAGNGQSESNSITLLRSSDHSEALLFSLEVKVIYRIRSLRCHHQCSRATFQAHIANAL